MDCLSPDLLLAYGMHPPPLEVSSSVRGAPENLKRKSSTATTATASYGGHFPWVGVHFRMRVKKGLSPLQWANSLAKNALLLKDIILEVNGGFCRPGDPEQ